MWGNSGRDQLLSQSIALKVGVLRYMPSLPPSDPVQGGIARPGGALVAVACARTRRSRRHLFCARQDWRTPA